MRRALVIVLYVVMLSSPTRAAEHQDQIRLLRMNSCVHCDLRAANLREADLEGANLEGAQLWSADLTGADMAEANLSSAELEWADLTGAQLWRANLTWAHLSRADLTGAYLGEANLIGAQLRSANLSGASLQLAELEDAQLIGTDLSGADLSYAELGGAVFEPRPDKLPDLISLGFAHGFHELRFIDSPNALWALRAAFRDAGRRDLERQITFAIKRTERQLAGPVEAAFNYVLFEITCEYGMSPGRPLMIIAIGILVLSAIYWCALRVRSGTSGIWLQYDANRVYQGEGSTTPARLYCQTLSCGVGFAVLFSLLSAFHVGWREFDIGSWIARINPKEFTLRATGWVRVVSGLQSLASVYLLALWALSYFGRPFG